MTQGGHDGLSSKPNPVSLFRPVVVASPCACAVQQRLSFYCFVVHCDTMVGFSSSAHFI